MSGPTPARVYCPVCQARFPLPAGKAAGDHVVCAVCGQRLVVRSTPEGFVGDRPDQGTDAEIRERVDEYARLKGYVFNEMKEEVIQGLLGKRRRFGDFYCPCRMMHTPEYQCPCKPTRGGDVERDGKCYCGFFWKR